MLLCSRPALHCRDNHSMYKAMNDDQIVRLCLWHSRSALLYHKAGGSQCLTGERAAKQETLVGSVSWDWVYFNILSHGAHMLSFFFLTHSSSAEHRLYILPLCECFAGLCLAGLLSIPMLLLYPHAVHTASSTWRWTFPLPPPAGGLIKKWMINRHTVGGSMCSMCCFWMFS